MGLSGQNPGFACTREPGMPGIACTREPGMPGMPVPALRHEHDKDEKKDKTADEQPHGFQFLHVYLRD